MSMMRQPSSQNLTPVRRPGRIDEFVREIHGPIHLALPWRCSTVPPSPLNFPGLP